MKETNTYLGSDIKKLGFGLMRLPTDTGKPDGKIDIAKSCEMVDAFMAAGFTYFDTAYGYSGGESERAIKAALVDRYPRESFKLATKLPAWHGASSEAEARAMFDTSFERTGAGYFDFYLLHNVGSVRTAAFDKFHMWEYIAELKAAGKIRHAGFSFHDTAELLDEVLTKHPEMEFVQLQINYADWNSGGVQSRRCWETAWKKHGKPVVIMEPVKGGMLSDPHETVKAALDAANPNVSYSSWAIRFAASLDGIITVLSGMTTIEQMNDNISTMKDFVPLSETERGAVDNAIAALNALPGIPCTGCRYCVEGGGCPMNVVIPNIFDAFNRKLIFGDEMAAKFGYAWETNFGAKASACVACGHCETVCPQKIPIIERLKEAAAAFE
ncbi:MAG: aldo/keto reductase [Oscillospiraceae bacterium]|jgi:predicted aldo/keto reductase-like oxidoreductase|nr:aldo/keto reductase [Oscillospiraceae bacterium]